MLNIGVTREVRHPEDPNHDVLVENVMIFYKNIMKPTYNIIIYLHGMCKDIFKNGLLFPGTCVTVITCDIL